MTDLSFFFMTEQSINIFIGNVKLCSNNCWFQVIALINVLCMKMYLFNILSLQYCAQCLRHVVSVHQRPCLRYRALVSKLFNWDYLK